MPYRPETFFDDGFLKLDASSRMMRSKDLLIPYVSASNFLFVGVLLTAITSSITVPFLKLLYQALSVTNFGSNTNIFEQNINDNASIMYRVFT